MAARDATVSVPAATWTKLTNGSVLTDVTIALLTSGTVYLQATNADSAPGDTDGLPLYAAGNGFKEVTLAEIFGGVTLTSAAYLWAYAPNKAVDFYVSHA